VASYSWGASNPSGGTNTASLQNFTLTVAPTSAEPGLWGHLAAGSHLHAATIHVRKDNFGVGQPVEYLTYNLTNVTIASFATGSSDQGPQDTIELAYDAMTESYTRFSSHGPSTTTSTRSNQVTGIRSALGGLAEPAIGSYPLGATFDDGIAAPELEIDSYSWGATNPGGAGASGLQNLSLSLAPLSDEPGLWGRLAIGRQLDSVTIHVRKNGAQSPLEDVTYTLTNVTITSFSRRGVPN